MNAEKDYYLVLGVLPDAESVVIVAAYRALASLYHPDKWKGDVSEATRRMAEINVAYGVLSDAVKRRAYDAIRKSSHSTFEPEDEQRDAAFDKALTELEDRWQVATTIFPDLVDIRKRLKKTAHRLAFAYVVVMLETKLFQNRIQVAETMENEFLERHFGTDKRIISFAKELIALNLKDAIVALNRYVDVLGSDIEAKPIIDGILKKYSVREAQKAASESYEESHVNFKNSEKIANLKSFVQYYRSEDDSIKLAALLGYEVKNLRGGFFQPDIYEVWKIDTNQLITTCPTKFAFIEWTIQTLCKAASTPK